MKTLFISIAILCTTLLVNAQPQQLTSDFAPIGSHWYYTNIPNFFSSAQNYMEIESIGDTIIQNKNCRHLKKSYGSVIENDEFVYSNGDTIYRLADNDTFYVLYNFGAQVGETWLTRSSLYTDGTEQIEMTITVDSLSSEIINGYLLRVLYLSSSDPSISFGGDWALIGKARIIERMGGSWYMFPFNYGFLENNIRIGLRCYSDDSLGFYNAGISQNCDEIIIGIKDESNPTSINIYPNPFSTHLTFKYTDNEPLSVSLYNILGQQVIHQTFTNSMTITADQLPIGIYIYELRDNKETIKKGKVIKQ